MGDDNDGAADGAVALDELPEPEGDPVETDDLAEAREEADALELASVRAELASFAEPEGSPYEAEDDAADDDADGDADADCDEYADDYDEAELDDYVDADDYDAADDGGADDGGADDGDADGGYDSAGGSE